MNTDGYVIAFDFGLKYIGVAIGQTLTGSARGVTTLSARQGKPRWHELNAVLEEYRPARAVVGLPLNMDGSQSDMAERAQAFADQLSRRTRLQTVMHDERLTSRTAKDEFSHAKALGKAATEHELAACLILESWIAS